jgi:hypothetical protein
VNADAERAIGVNGDLADKRSPWVDDRLRALPDRPWRKIHMDFNNTGDVGGIGADFDPEEFAQTLKHAHVDSIVLMSKDIYGYSYYPTEVGTPHPGLVCDLFGGQVEVCRSAGIKAYAYTPVSWDELSADAHPEWLALKRDRSSWLPAIGEAPLWTALCISHPALIDLVRRNTTEVLERYKVDGMWFDMPFPIGARCYCARCLAFFRDEGLDPGDGTVQRRHKQQLFIDLLRQLTTHARSVRADVHVEYNQQANLGLRERLPHLDNVDIEALPTGGWGYEYFPIHARYVRTLGVSYFGMTGKFNRAWGDYGGLKHPTQLRTELATIVAHGARCDIGDEGLPGGRLSPAVYDTIGEAYEEVERLEPYLDRAVPATEAAILVDGEPPAHFIDLILTETEFPSVHGSGVGGMAKLLTESQVQFDICDTRTEFERYRLVVLPDAMEVGASLASRLNEYLSRGGAVIASHRAVRTAEGDDLWPEALRGAYRGAAPYPYPYIRLEREAFDDLARYAEFDFTLYNESDRWELAAGRADVLATLTEPMVSRPANSWQYPPPGQPTQYAAVVQAGRLAAFAFPLAITYYEHGYWLYRKIFTHILDRLLPRPLVTTTAPQSAEVTVTHQAASSEHGARWIVHVVNHSPLRRSASGNDLEPGDRNVAI